MTDQELVRELVKRKLVGNSEAEQALRDGAFVGRSAEEILYEKRQADEVAVAKVKSELTGVPYKQVDASEVSEELVRSIPRETAVTYRLAPISKSGNMLVVGMMHPDDLRAQEALKFIAKQQGVSLGVYLVTPTDLAAVWRRYAPYQTEIAAAVKEIGRPAEEPGHFVGLEEGGSADDAPIIKIVASTLQEAVQQQASDIHIEPQRGRLRIRMRLDGELREVASLPPSLAQPIVSRVKVLSRLKLDETRIPQDGRFRTFLFGRDIDYRVATFPTPAGEKVAIRVLDTATGLKGLDQLGLNKWNAGALDEAVGRPFGMLLLSGPTGSGKTTTLYAMMQRINKESQNILTLEDPVEYFMEGINQSQVKPEIGYTFASGLRQILRQDPDVIMVGEIRDSETADLAVNAALTGHVVLSTIHTNNAIGVIPRLVDLGVPPFLLSSALNLLMAQRLVVQICPSCRVPVAASKDAAHAIEEALANMPEGLLKDVPYKPPYTVYQVQPKADCKICHGRGIAGRVAIFEMFRMTRELGDLITRGFTEGTLRDEALRQGMVTLRQDAVLKALDGSMSMEEVLSETATPRS